MWNLRVSENRVRKEITGDSRRLHNEELHNLYTPPNIIRVIKLGRVRWL
jgi:hypothetical protein